MSDNKPRVVEERRSFPRVKDAIGLEFRVITEKPIPGEPVEFERRAKVRVANKYDIEGYAEIKRSYPAVADYIDRLEERIRQLLLNGGQTAEQPTHTVSLSACGIAFADDRLLLKGQLIRMQLTLFPDVTRITCDGILIDVEDGEELQSGSQHFYRVRFDGLASDTRAKIEAHVNTVRRSLRQVDEPRVFVQH